MKTVIASIWKFIYLNQIFLCHRLQRLYPSSTVFPKLWSAAWIWLADVFCFIFENRELAWKSGFPAFLGKWQYWAAKILCLCLEVIAECWWAAVSGTYSVCRSPSFVSSWCRDAVSPAGWELSMMTFCSGVLPGGRHGSLRCKPDDHRPLMCASWPNRSVRLLACFYTKFSLTLLITCTSLRQECSSLEKQVGFHCERISHPANPFGEALTIRFNTERLTSVFLDHLSLCALTFRLL